MSNASDTIFFKKKFTNWWYGEWLLVNKKMMLVVDLKTNKKLAITTICKNVVNNLLL